MKLRFTTPASTSMKKRLHRVVIGATAILMAGAGSLQYLHVASADQYDDQIATLQSQIKGYQQQASVLSAQAQTLQQQIDQIQQQENIIQAQIDLSQAQYDKLTEQIADTQKQIGDNQKALGDTLADLYIDSQTTPLEMLASSKSISDYLDKQTQQAAVKDQLSQTITKITALKAELTQQKTDVTNVLNQQTSQRNQLAAQQSAQAQLLQQTQNNEAAYQQLVTTAQQQINAASAAQRAYYASLGGNTSAGVYGSFQYRNLTPSNGAGGCSGGYPYCQAQDSMIDPWQLYNRECVSYVAWALVNRFGKSVHSFNGQGNAYEWPSSAPRFSGAVRVYDPKPGDAVILPQSGSFSPLGHAMIVESAPDSNGWIHVSQYNFYGTGQYSQMDIQGTGVIFLRFPSA